MTLLSSVRTHLVHPWRLSALACLAAFALAPVQAEPQAAVVCADSVAITSHLAYADACQNPVQGNVTDTLVATFGGFDYAHFGDTKGNDGPFKNAPHGVFSGTLNLKQKLYGPFVLGLKAQDGYSLYLFDGGGAGVDGIAFDTLGVAKGDNGKLSQAFVFTPGGMLPEKPFNTLAAEAAAQPVPEPGTSALVLAALAAIGLTARRRLR